MVGLQQVIASCISNLLLRQKHNYESIQMFEALNTSMSGRISRDEFRAAFETYNIAEQMPLKSNHEHVTADELFNRIKNCCKIIQVPSKQIDQKTNDEESNRFRLPEDDVDNITFSEFLAVCRKKEDLLHDSNLESAFMMFDAKHTFHLDDLIEIEFLKDFLCIPDEATIEELQKHLKDFGQCTIINDKWYLTKIQFLRSMSKMKVLTGHTIDRQLGYKRQSTAVQEEKKKKMVEETKGAGNAGNPKASSTSRRPGILTTSSKNSVSRRHVKQMKDVDQENQRSELYKSKKYKDGNILQTGVNLSHFQMFGDKFNYEGEMWAHGKIMRPQIQ